jgi:hypothetical protein
MDIWRWRTDWAAEETESAPRATPIPLTHSRQRVRNMFAFKQRTLPVIQSLDRTTLPEPFRKRQRTRPSYLSRAHQRRGKFLHLNPSRLLSGQARLRLSRSLHEALFPPVGTTNNLQCIQSSCILRSFVSAKGCFLVFHIDRKAHVATEARSCD